MSARPLHGDRQSELGYVLDHAETFQGHSYYRTSPKAFATHRAWLDLNLLPVADTYLVPGAATDEQVQPTAKREAAL